MDGAVTTWPFLSVFPQIEPTVPDDWAHSNAVILGLVPRICQLPAGASSFLGPAEIPQAEADPRDKPEDDGSTEDDGSAGMRIIRLSKPYATSCCQE
jgi:hypothetical protein